jgi:hypothetical protein
MHVMNACVPCSACVSNCLWCSLVLCARVFHSWAETLSTVSDVLEEWIKVQRSWLYLQPIFDSSDIQRQLPTEYKRFSTVDKNWRQTLSAAKSHPKAIKFCANEKLLEKFQESNKFLDLVQKGLSDYLETKRAAFARFYFLSNDELLEVTRCCCCKTAGCCFGDWEGAGATSCCVVLCMCAVSPVCCCQRVGVSCCRQC